MSPLHSCASEQLASTGRRKHTHVAFLCITLRFRVTRCISDQLDALGCKRIQFHSNLRPSAGVEHALLWTTGAFSNASRLLTTQAHTGRPCVADQKLRQNAGMVPATSCSKMQGRPVSGFMFWSISAMATQLWTESRDLSSFHLKPTMHLVHFEIRPFNFVIFTLLWFCPYGRSYYCVGCHASGFV